MGERNERKRQGRLRLRVARGRMRTDPSAVCGSRDDGDGVLSPSCLWSLRSLTDRHRNRLSVDLCPCLSSRDFDETSTWGMRQSEGSILYQSDAAWIILDYPSQSVGSILFGLFSRLKLIWTNKCLCMLLFNGFCVIVFCVCRCPLGRAIMNFALCTLNFVG